MDDSLSPVLRRLLLNRSTAALATLRAGRPAASMIPFAVHVGPDGLRLVTHVSGLSAHTREMRAAAEVGLLVTAAESPGTMPQELPRVSIEARAEFIPSDHPDHATLADAYLARFPDTAPFFRLGDFTIVAFRPETARFVAGFARAVTLSPEALAAAVAERA